MKSSAIFLILILAILQFTPLAVSQSAGAHDPYKQTLDRLDGLTRQSGSEWRFHADARMVGLQFTFHVEWSRRRKLI